jgi:ribosomal protein S18 acetylase RimI-like enzyme
MYPVDETTAIKLIPATQYTLEQLVDIYNQTRIDYMVPMPMNKARLVEYIKTYDVSLEHSIVATLNNGELLGVIMLGVRKERVWVTRLGVIPNNRRLGIGRALMNGLIEQAKKLSIHFFILEVIKNNIPAHQMFLKFGFREIGELLILRRSPFSKEHIQNTIEIKELNREQTLNYLSNDQSTKPWTNQYESYANAEGISGLHITLANGSSGWLAYQRQKFLLSRFVMKTETGNPQQIAHALLSHLHQQYPRLDTQIENIKSTDPHLPAFYEAGYIESFRRNEMWLGDSTFTK